MSTATEIAAAIERLSPTERQKLLRRLPDLLPEIEDDAVWQRIISDARPRPGLTTLVNETEATFEQNPDAFPNIDPTDFETKQ